MHRLVQATVIRAMTTEEKAMMFDLVLSLVARTFSNQDDGEKFVDRWEDCIKRCLISCGLKTFGEY